MAGLPITYPLIGGLRYDFTAISFFANGTPIVGITKLDYDQELAPTDVYATMPQKIGATRGQLKPTATLTMLQLEYELFIVALCALNGTPGSGYMEVRWDMQVLYQDGAGLNQGPLFNHILRGCKIKKEKDARAPGGEANAVDLDLDLFYIQKNGQIPVTINPTKPFSFFPG